MFYPVFFAIVGLILWVGLRRDPGMAIRRVSLTVMLFAPAWMICQLKSISLDHRTAAMGGALALCVALWGHVPLRKWLWTDTCVLVLYLGQIVSQVLIDELRPLTAFELARAWVLPYLLGRVFFLRWHGDMSRTLPWVAGLLVLTFGLDAFEALAKVNLPNKALGKSFSLLEAGEGYRWGMKRSQGPMNHPIYNGMMLTLLLPWAAAAARRWKSPDGRRWWIAVPFLLAGAVFFTVSRGPQLAFLITCGVVTFFRFRRWRLLLAVVAVVGGTAVYLGKDPLMAALKSAGGETEDSVRMIVLDGQEYEYTGSNHRTLLFVAYGPGLRQAGWFGYGAGMKDVPMADGDTERFGSIDNHYVKHLLEFGWVGFLSFVGLAVFSCYYATRMAWDPDDENSMFSAAMCGAIASTSLMLLTVWFSFDFGSFWLFSTGMTGCLYTLRPRDAERRARAARRRLDRPPSAGGPPESDSLVRPADLVAGPVVLTEQRSSSTLHAAPPGGRVGTRRAPLRRKTRTLGAAASRPRRRLRPASLAPPPDGRGP